MYRKIRYIVLAIAGSAAVVSPLQGQLSKEQIEANKANWQSHILTIKGSQTPSEIPYGEKMSIAFRIFEARQARLGPEEFRNSLRAKYGGSTAEVDGLNDAVIHNRTFINTVADEERRELKALCEEIESDGGSLTARQIAERLRDISINRLNSLDSHYSMVMNNLSFDVRANVLSEIDTRFVPGIAYGTTDHLGLADSFPVAYPQVMKNNCSRWLASNRD